MISTFVALARRRPDITSAAFLAIAFLTGIAGALQLPTLCLFLSQEVEARPFMVGLFYTGSAVIGIFISQFLAVHSDKHGDRKILIFNCCLLGALGCVLFAYDRNYYLLLCLGVLLTSFCSIANPQLFALAREHADNTGREAVMFSSVLRVQVSLAWVIGPPLAFALVMGFGFKTMYLMASVTFLLCGALVWLMLPSMRKTQRQAREALEAPRRNRQDTLRLFGACTLMWTCNCMYLINMPLYILHELHLPEKTAGVMMGTATGLEIPTMLLAGWLSRRWGKRRLMRLAVVAGALFHLGMLTMRDPTALLMLQWLNALFIGILAGIGMIYFQDLMPGQAGAATALFTNSGRVGWIIAGSLASLVAEIGQFHSVFSLSLLMIAGAGYCMWRIRDVDSPQPRDTLQSLCPAPTATVRCRHDHDIHYRSLLMARANEIKRGMSINYNGKLLLVKDIDIQSPSARGASTLYKMRFADVRTGLKVEERFKGDDILDTITLTRRSVTFSYVDGDEYIFMDDEDYTPYIFKKDQIEDELLFIPEGGIPGMQVLTMDGAVLALELPQTVDLDIVDTTPGIKGASASARTKPATLTTGLVIQVPEYLSSGERIRIHVAERRYMGRAD